MEKRKILFLALGYPNVAKSTVLYTDLMQEFAGQGHKVLVVAPAYEKGNYGRRVEGNVEVLRVKTLPLFKVGPIKKGIANILLPFQYKKAIRKNGDMDFDLVILPTPPITLFSVAYWLKSKIKAKTYLILRDIFPQNAVDLEMMRENGILHRYFRKQELKLYKLADSIGCMSKANISYVKQHNPGLDHSKLHLLPNWEKIPLPVSKEGISKVSSKLGISDKFVAIFGGNLGKPQQLENIVGLAKSCREIKDIFFLILGSGTESERVKQLIEHHELTNIRLVGRVPKKEYVQILAAADVGLISLHEQFTIPNFPSKVLTYFGLKKPVLASLDLSTDFGQMLEETKSGLWSEAGDIEAFKKNLLWFYDNREQAIEMGENGYNYMKSHLTPEIAYKTIMENI
ncbi:MAG: glycosyltransferase WbuB [Muricauda sp.]|nr:MULTISPECIES: glycosyltransferase family 4 protein [unclassified Allomuricauda]MAU15673.1 glycosyltransferase WbuB [Allomuricauda sp.]|tara:strand:+ start:3390 stop:4586 length:1197 start_codon:yes stop_codon:yes gene_type:complete